MTLNYLLRISKSKLQKRPVVNKTALCPYYFCKTEIILNMHIIYIRAIDKSILKPIKLTKAIFNQHAVLVNTGMFFKKHFDLDTRINVSIRLCDFQLKAPGDCSEM